MQGRFELTESRSDHVDGLLSFGPLSRLHQASLKQRERPVSLFLELIPDETHDEDVLWYVGEKWRSERDEVGGGGRGGEKGDGVEGGFEGRRLDVGDGMGLGG